MPNTGQFSLFTFAFLLPLNIFTSPFKAQTWSSGTQISPISKVFPLPVPVMLISYEPIIFKVGTGCIPVEMINELMDCEVFPNEVLKPKPKFNTLLK